MSLLSTNHSRSRKLSWAPTPGSPATGRSVGSDGVEDLPDPESDADSAVQNVADEAGETNEGVPPAEMTVEEAMAQHERVYGERTVDVICKWWNLIPKAGADVVHKAIFMKLALQLVTLLEVADELESDPEIELNERWDDALGEDKWTMTCPEFVVMMAEMLRWCIGDDDTDVYLDTQVVSHLTGAVTCVQTHVKKSAVNVANWTLRNEETVMNKKKQELGRNNSMYSQLSSRSGVSSLGWSRSGSFVPRAKLPLAPKPVSKKKKLVRLVRKVAKGKGSSKMLAPAASQGEEFGPESKPGITDEASPRLGNMEANNRPEVTTSPCSSDHSIPSPTSSDLSTHSGFSLMVETGYNHPRAQQPSALTSAADSLLSVVPSFRRKLFQYPPEDRPITISGSWEVAESPREEVEEFAPDEQTDDVHSDSDVQAGSPAMAQQPKKRLPKSRGVYPFGLGHLPEPRKNYRPKRQHKEATICIPDGQNKNRSDSASPWRPLPEWSSLKQSCGTSTKKTAQDFCLQRGALRTRRFENADSCSSLAASTISLISGNQGDQYTTTC
mmetsp:Transcript_79407/g.140128  ORF Transcript_79407/g.140128 Transcript_79407/m.140128 type:complete len:555 (-) Transcript_79407:120-1784(-)